MQMRSVGGIVKICEHSHELYLRNIIGNVSSCIHLEATRQRNKQKATQFLWCPLLRFLKLHPQHSIPT